MPCADEERGVKAHFGRRDALVVESCILQTRWRILTLEAVKNIYSAKYD